MTTDCCFPTTVPCAGPMKFVDNPTQIDRILKSAGFEAVEVVDGKLHFCEFHENMTARHMLGNGVRVDFKKPEKP